MPDDADFRDDDDLRGGIQNSTAEVLAASLEDLGGMSFRSRDLST
ncbi:hypothetical protein ABZZ36_42315 [Actinacidiphila glaucinigra]